LPTFFKNKKRPENKKTPKKRKKVSRIKKKRKETFLHLRIIVLIRPVAYNLDSRRPAAEAVNFSGEGRDSARGLKGNCYAAE